ncbi:uncharacterized protein LODBEIA_P13170 [Lodderomyces beijingensis]|uniref:Proteasome assembly chaperone 3 n=1 Tax=Lodderomyces beijingensis TaxID=1775926 RepID=A0ABP0ZG08_9ASCO
MAQPATTFSKSLAAVYPPDSSDSADETQFHFHLVEFQDKFVLNISINGILDSTFKLPVSTKRAINYEAMMDLYGANEPAMDESDSTASTTAEPQLLIGDYANMKISIIAGQICKLISQQKPKETILSIGSRWFGKGDEVGPDDFAKLMFVIENVKTLLL